MNVVLLVMLIVFAVHISVVDVRTMRIPDRWLIRYSICFGVYRLVQPSHPWWMSYATCMAFFVVAMLLLAFRLDWIGGGDLKLLAVLSLVLGARMTLQVVVMAIVLGSVFGLLVLVLGKMPAGRAIPFAPFLFAAVGLALLLTHSSIS